MKKRKFFILSTLTLVLFLGFFYFFKKGNLNKSEILVNSLAMVEKVTQFLPIDQNTKDEIQAIDKFVQYFTVKDGVERKYLLLLQNNMELRPTGGFLGQYAVVKIKNGEATSLFVEDANLLDQRITADVPAPYPFERMISIRRWKFRDSNFYPDFPTSVDKIKYFYRLAGGNDNFDGVIAVNATVLGDILEITGPVAVPGYPGTYTSENAVLKLEENVGKAYRLNPDLDDRNRKIILKKMAAILIDELSSISNFSKVSNLVFEELRNKEVQFYFENQEMQALAEKVGWAGKVNQEWDGDYLMAVDANLGALKSDYYMDREMIYSVDLTAEKPTATLEIIYTHNATYGDWMTSDYHSYLRVYTPLGTELISREMVSYPNIQENHGRQYFGFTCHTIMNDQTHAKIVYNLPEEIRDGYKLLIQKQSGVGDVPVTINIKTEEKEYNQKEILKNELKFELRKQ